eukprot:scaffold2117_cov241-Pinguiococcus_pyrenoidosus.AAC.6
MPSSTLSYRPFSTASRMPSRQSISPKIISTWTPCEGANASVRSPGEAGAGAVVQLLRAHSRRETDYVNLRKRTRVGCLLPRAERRLVPDGRVVKRYLQVNSQPLNDADHARQASEGATEIHDLHHGEHHGEGVQLPVCELYATGPLRSNLLGLSRGRVTALGPLHERSVLDF